MICVFQEIFMLIILIKSNQELFLVLNLTLDMLVISDRFKEKNFKILIGKLRYERFSTVLNIE